MNMLENVSGMEMQKPGKTGFLNMVSPKGIDSQHPCCSGSARRLTGNAQIGNPADLSNLGIRIIFKKPK